MANPKYIDESLLPKSEDDKTNKKANKKAYSFRCDETLLEEMTKYAEMENISLPQLLNDMMANFINSKTLTNTYLPEYEGMYINIPTNIKGSVKTYEYEIRYIMNNLDEWTADYGYIAKSRLSEGIIHEGIDFLIIPETLHGGKLPDREREMLQLTHALNLNYIPYCLYCIYITVSVNGTIEHEAISWIKAINKLKAVGRYDIISHANQIKKELEELHQKWISDREICDDEEMMWQGAYGRILKMAKTYNTGAILPAEDSINNIEYAPIIKKLPDNYDLINKLMRENMELKTVADELNDIKKLIGNVESLSDEELLEMVHERQSQDHKLDG